MYNGIGIQSTRGTGTSGHVQRNVAALHRSHRRRTSKSNPNEELRNALLKQSGGAQRAHEALRRVEVAVAELEEELGARGYDDDTIAQMAERLRKDLLSRDDNEGKGEKDREIEKGRNGTELMEHRNEKLRNVLGLEHDYAEGSAFRNMRTREERGKEEEKRTGDEAKDALVNGKSDKNALATNTAKPPEPSGDDNEISKAGPALSDTDSSSLSQSSDESDSDDAPEVPDVVEPTVGAIRTATERNLESAVREPSPKRAQADDKATREVGDSGPRPVSPSPDESRQQNQAPRSPHRFPSKSPSSRSVSPSPRNGYGRRGRTHSPSLQSEDRGNNPPSRRDFSPRRRVSQSPRNDLPRSSEISPRSRDLSPVRRAPYPYDQYGTPKFRNGSSFARSPSPRRHSSRRSPYDKRPTPHASHEYQATLYDHSRSRHARPTYRRRSRSRSLSRSHSRDRYRRYRDESPDSTSTSSRSPSPYMRRSSPRNRSLSPRRDVSPYGRDRSRRRSPAPYSRKRRYSGYTPPRRVRHRRRSIDGYRRRRRSERRERDRRYSSSDSDSSRSPSRYGTPPRRSRFSEYPASPSLTPPRYTRRYEESPSR